MAALCERVLTDKDEVHSLVRVVNKFTIRGPAPTMPGGICEFVAAIGLKRGDADRKHEFRLTCMAPNGNAISDYVQQAEFPSPGGAETGLNFFLNVRLTVQETGCYWIHVLVDGRIATKIPFVIDYEQVQTGTHQAMPPALTPSPPVRRKKR
jgi:hypothetical protein